MLKGYIRLLDLQSEHQWQYHETSSLQRVDLLVVHEAVEPWFYAPTGAQLQPVLRLGTRGVNKPFYQTLPLKPYELLNEMNRLGRMLDTSFVPQVKATPAIAPTAVLQATDSVTKELIRLKQWPPARLLSEPGRMRLATLLTGRAMSMDELQHRAALAETVCRSFIKDMQTVGLLTYTAAQDSLPTQMTLAGGASAPKPVARPVARPAVQLSLLEKIRLRLGIRLPDSA
jgi:hypothetical protein